MKRMWLVVAMAVMAVSACSSPPSAREKAQAFLNDLHDKNIKLASGLMVKPADFLMTAVQTKGDKIFRDAILSREQYVIQSVSQSGNQATVQVRVTEPNTNDALGQIMGDSVQYEMGIAVGKEDDSLMEQIAGIIRKAPLYTHTVPLYMVKRDNAWMVGPGNDKFFNAVDAIDTPWQIPKN